MGLVESKPKESVSTHKRVEIDAPSRAQLLSSLNPETHSILKSALTGEISSLLDRLCIATVGMVRPSSATLEAYMAKLNCNTAVLQSNLRFLAQALMDISKLTTGNHVLREINSFLQRENLYLVVAFVGAQGTSPMAKLFKFIITKSDGSDVSDERRWNSVLINFSERWEDSYRLPFYNATTDEVETVEEPTFLVMIHELSHGIQELSHPDSYTDKSVLSELIERFPTLALANSMNQFAKFFGDLEACWPLELQVMVTGVRCASGIMASESQAIREFLAGEGGLLDDARFTNLQRYRSQELYPFGHGKQDDTPSNRMILRALIQAVNNQPIDHSTLRDVPHDGDCGVWALLQGMHPDVDYLHARGAKMEEMQDLRTQAAVGLDPAAANRIGTPAAHPGDLAHWITTDDFQHFARVLERPIGVIVANNGFRLFYDTGAADTDPTRFNLENFVELLTPRTLVVYQEGIHYQAVTEVRAPGGITWRLPPPPAPQGPVDDEHAMGRDDALGCD
ncbi:MAG: hypothetical protein LBD69_02885 [Puniceicoccales bacterium]|jgi:hypothetical protein|nr:hypothetical protein [Puniceicoccales bacterium]